MLHMALSVSATPLAKANTVLDEVVIHIEHSVHSEAAL